MSAPILTFGEVAAGLGLRGSTPSGWPCPCCHAPEGVVELTALAAGSCKACGARFDRQGYVMWLRACSPDEALNLILEISSAANSLEPGSCGGEADAEPANSPRAAQTSGRAAKGDPQ